MKMIYTDSNFIEQNYLKNAEIDIDIGKHSIALNDIDITIPTHSCDPKFGDGSLVYISDSEYGGIIKGKKVNTSDEEITFKGITFRGMLEKEYVQPPDGEAYLILKGEANEIIEQLLLGRYGDLFIVDNVGLSDITVDYQIRDMNLLEALEKMLYKADIPSRIDINFYDGKVHLQAIPIVDLSELLQYDNSYNLSMVAETSSYRYNHILILGQGELTGRTRINLYLTENNTWSQDESESYCKGLNRRTYKYENVNESDVSVLIEDAIEKATEENGTDTLSIAFESDDAELFNIVGAREDITGIFLKEQITQKILKGTISNDNENLTIEYKVGE